jgi:hypothetical protein
MKKFLILNLFIIIIEDILQKLYSFLTKKLVKEKLKRKYYWKIIRILVEYNGILIRKI